MKCNYEFTLKFAVPVRTDEPVDWIDRLAEAGCDDALLGTGIPGRLALDFDRVATDADSALRSAVADVQRAIPGARLIEAGPGLCRAHRNRRTAGHLASGDAEDHGEKHRDVSAAGARGESVHLAFEGCAWVDEGENLLSQGADKEI